MGSSILNFFSLLVVTSDLATIFVNSQVNLEKWKLEAPTITYDQEIDRFEMEFDVDDSLTVANIMGSLWTKECEEGGDALPTAGITYFDYSKNAVDKALLHFTVQPAPFQDNNQVFTNLQDASAAKIEFCARFMLIDDISGYEINYIEALFEITYDLSEGGFAIEDFNVGVLERERNTRSKAYGVIGYLCDPSNPSVALVSSFNQGSIISVCVTPEPEAVEDGLLIEKINYFNWYRGDIEQPAIYDGHAAGNALTLYTCPPLSLYCGFTSILWADFYRPSMAPSTQPTEMPTIQPTQPIEMPTIQPIITEICEGVSSVSETTLNFTVATIKENNIHTGGALRYGDIGSINGSVVDLLVTSTDYYNPNSNANGVNPSGNFGNIAVRTVEGDPESGKGTFQFCFVLNNTETLVMAESFQWSVFDLDNRGGGINEKMSIDVSQTSGYSLYPDETNTEISITCENDGSNPPCDEGVRTVFGGTTRGGGNDNPTDPNNLTEQQLERSIVFTFVNTSCWTMEFNAYCTLEPTQTCTWYGGSNLLFSGGASQIIQQGSTECTDEEDEERKLEGSLPNWMSTNTVEGYGEAILNFDTSRRLNMRKKDKRRLQGGQSSGLSITIPIIVDDDNDYVLKTADGSSALFPYSFVTLCLLTTAVLAFF